MLKGSIKYFLVLVFLLVAPIMAWAGHTIPDTDFEEDQIYFFWDLRDRSSFFQVTNTEGFGVTVHIQVFNAATGCAEFDYFDTFTGNDTHLYDVSNLNRNNGVPLAAPDLTGGFGFVAVSLTIPGNFVLLGNARIIDNSGYEYRVNAAGNFEFADVAADINTFNLYNVGGATTTFADVVGIPVIGDGLTTVVAGPTVTVTFNPVTLFDVGENPVSCPPVTFACAPGSFDLGVNQAITNSKGAGSLCLGTGTSGYVELDFAGFGGGADFFVGFIGLNNGDGTGSMDTWWGAPFLLNNDQ